MTVRGARNVGVAHALLYQLNKPHDHVRPFWSYVRY